MTTLALDFDPPAMATSPAADLPAWECAQVDQERYLRWVWEVSHLPFIVLALSPCRDAYHLKLARSWRRRMDEWSRHQAWLEMRGNPHAWNANVPTYQSVLRFSAATEDDIEDGTDLMLEIGYLGISDEWRMDTEARP